MHERGRARACTSLVRILKSRYREMLFAYVNRCLAAQLPKFSDQYQPTANSKLKLANAIYILSGQPTQTLHKPFSISSSLQHHILQYYLTLLMIFFRFLHDSVYICCCCYVRFCFAISLFTKVSSNRRSKCEFQF